VSLTISISLQYTGLSLFVAKERHTLPQLATIFLYNDKLGRDNLD